MSVCGCYPPPSKKAKTKYCITISELAEYFSIYQARFEAITVFCRFCVLWAFWSCSHYVKYPPPSHLTGKGVQCDNNMCTYSHLAIWLILRSSLWQPGFTVLLHGSIRHSTLFSGRQSPETTTKITGYQTNINLSGNFVSSILIGFVWKKEAHLKPLHISFFIDHRGKTVFQCREGESTISKNTISKTAVLTNRIKCFRHILMFYSHINFNTERNLMNYLIFHKLSRNSSQVCI